VSIILALYCRRFVGTKLQCLCVVCIAWNTLHIFCVFLVHRFRVPVYVCVIGVMVSIVVAALTWLKRFRMYAASRFEIKIRVDKIMTVERVIHSSCLDLLHHRSLIYLTKSQSDRQYVDGSTLFSTRLQFILRGENILFFDYINNRHCICDRNGETCKHYVYEREREGEIDMN